jgi:Thiamine pyrophosphate-requiring enzymes [acetolactate synthase, pyruvate dehydrogenase (cytochrome), glyoxylate carboligase, phosphonopyruvate decarboxylase]
MEVAKALVDRLVTGSITTVFGIPGKQTLPLNEAIDGRDDIRFVMARHETAVTHQAWGHAEATGEMAATVVVPGPGDLNAANGLKNALNDCTPMVHIAVETEPAVRGGDGIHETPPQTYDPLVKANLTVETAPSVIAELERAITIARTPPKGPVRIGVPKNFLPTETDQAASRRAVPESPAPVPAAIDESADLLMTATSPLLIAGGGVRTSGASPQFRGLAERLDAPVATTYKGKGTFPEDHPLFTGVLCGGASEALTACVNDADTVVAVGSDLDAVWTQHWAYDLDDDTELIHVTLSPADTGRGYQPSLALVADAKQTLEQLDTALADRPLPGGEGRSRAATVRDDIQARTAALRSVSEPPLTSVSALAAVRQAVPREAIVTADAGGSRIWTLVTFPVYEPRGFVTPGSWATMGTSLPAAIGAAAAEPDRDVVALAGEGGLMMSIHELHSAASERLDLAVVVFNNDDYAIISEEADRSYRMAAGEYSWSDDAPLSVSSVAEGMGVKAFTARRPAAVTDAVERAITHPGPALVEVPTDSHEPQASSHMRD